MSRKTRLFYLQCTEDLLVWELLRQFAWEYGQDVRQVSGISFITHDKSPPCPFELNESMFFSGVENFQNIYLNVTKYKVIILEIKNRAQTD